jgi:hypothetical protein
VKEEPPFESATGPHLAALPAALQHPAAAPHSALEGFLTLEQLRERLPLSERTIRGLAKKGLLPVVVLPKSRRLLFDWETVRNALLRHQRGEGAA